MDLAPARHQPSEFEYISHTSKRRCFPGLAIIFSPVKSRLAHISPIHEYSTVLNLRDVGEAVPIERYALSTPIVKPLPRATFTPLRLRDSSQLHRPGARGDNLWGIKADAV